MKKSQVWTDEMGKDVELIDFLPMLYVDRKVAELNKEYSWVDYPGQLVPSSLGSSEREQVAIKILTLAKLAGGWCGVASAQFISFLERGNDSWGLIGLVNSGYFRKKMVMGVEVIFPTKKLLASQRVPTQLGPELE